VLAAVYIFLMVERLIRDRPLEGREHEVFVDHATVIFEGLIGERLRGP
jgi:hypothetical protein